MVAVPSGEEQWLLPGASFHHGIKVLMRRMSAVALSVAVTAMLFLSACSACGPRQNPDELREKTAETTAMLKQDAKAVAEGVREGIGRSNAVNLNSATKKELTPCRGSPTSKRPESWPTVRIPCPVSL